jgi:hypothetical protein
MGSSHARTHDTAYSVLAIIIAFKGCAASTKCLLSLELLRPTELEVADPFVGNRDLQLHGRHIVSHRKMFVCRYPLYFKNFSLAGPFSLTSRNSGLWHRIQETCRVKTIALSSCIHNVSCIENAGLKCFEVLSLLLSRHIRCRHLQGSVSPCFAALLLGHADTLLFLISTVSLQMKL